MGGAERTDVALERLLTHSWQGKKTQTMTLDGIHHFVFVYFSFFLLLLKNKVNMKNVPLLLQKKMGGEQRNKDKK